MASSTARCSDNDEGDDDGVVGGGGGGDNIKSKRRELFGRVNFRMGLLAGRLDQMLTEPARQPA